MSLFGDLPPPTSHLRPKEEKLEDEYKPQPMSVGAPDVKVEGQDPEDLNVLDRPDKSQRIETQDSGGLSSEQVTLALRKIGSHISNPDKFIKAAGLLRQLLESGALIKAHRDHVFEVVKTAFADFDNASEASLRRDYMKLCHSLDKRADALFNRPQRAQLEVYRIVGFLQNEMHTDDSFVFNKVLGRIKDTVAALPPATDEDEEAMAELQEAAAGSSSSDEEGNDDAGGGERQRRQRSGSAPSSRGCMEDRVVTAVAEEEQEGEGCGGSAAIAAAGGAAVTEVKREADGEMEEQQRQPEPGRAAAQAEAEAAAARDDAVAAATAAAAGDDYDESDPFGLDQLLPAPKRFKAAAPPAPPSESQPQGFSSAAGQGHSIDKSRTSSGSRSNAWTAAQALVMRRQALVECLITARGFHKTPWARTSVELLVEHYHKHRDRFTGEQQMAVDEMVGFVCAARLARPTGPSRKEINRDTTSFERARSAWSRATLSARGKVGASGDAKAQNWLG